MDRFPPTANPRIYTLSAMIVGYLLIGDFTANEQNSIGNWLFTVGQILENNCAFQQLFEERISGNTINTNSREFKNGGSPYMNNEPLINNLKDMLNDEVKCNCNELEEIKKALKLMSEKIEYLFQSKKN